MAVWEFLLTGGQQTWQRFLEYKETHGITLRRPGAYYAMNGEGIVVTAFFPTRTLGQFRKDFPEADMFSSKWSE